MTHPDLPNPSQVSPDIRCKCGKLVARWESNAISIKCVRCQRLVSIPYKEIQGTMPIPFFTDPK